MAASVISFVFGVWGAMEQKTGLIDLVITDPPYNVAYKGGTKDKLTIKNDDLSNEEFESLLRDFYVNAFVFMKEGAGIYVFHADSGGEIQHRMCHK